MLRETTPTNRNHSFPVPESLTTYEHLLPRPRTVRRRPGSSLVPLRVRIRLDNAGPDLLKAARQLLRGISSRYRVSWRLVSEKGKHVDVSIHMSPPGKAKHPQWYALSIRPDGIRLRAVSHAGLRYGVITLMQLLSGGNPRIAAMDIEDWPDFAVRGVMLDISRDKVPKPAELFRIIDQLADWKINQLQLYIEHTFAYRGHRRVWRDSSPLTATEVRRIDRYCRERGIELVPNQNSFGHMERWLKHEPYRRLAETDKPWRSPWGTMRDYASTLCPLAPGSLRLVSDLYRQLLPNFSSRLFNVGCDETFELGQGRSQTACEKLGTGRVYLDYLLKVHRLVKRHRRRMMFWADIILKYPKLIGRLPKDAVALIWGYEADHPFGRECRRVAGTGLDFYVCPGTSSWCSFSGRTTNARENLLKAAVAGARYGATGYLITDWGDFGHRQYAPVSDGPMLFGAAVAWCAKANRRIDTGVELDRHVYGAPGAGTGALWCRAGDVHLASGVSLMNRTVLFRAMEWSLPEIGKIEGLTMAGVRRMEARLRKLSIDASRAKPAGKGGTLAREELTLTIKVLVHACRRLRMGLQSAGDRIDRREIGLLAKDIRRIMHRHRAMWMARNRPGGLESSLGYYRKILDEYVALRRAAAAGATRSRRP